MHPELKSGDKILILGNQEVWPKNLPPIFVESNQCEMICSWHHGAVIVMVMILKVDHVKHCLDADDDALADDCEGC